MGTHFWWHSLLPFDKRVLSWSKSLEEEPSPEESIPSPTSNQPSDAQANTSLAKTTDVETKILAVERKIDALESRIDERFSGIESMLKKLLGADAGGAERARRVSDGSRDKRHRRGGDDGNTAVVHNDAGGAGNLGGLENGDEVHVRSHREGRRENVEQGWPSQEVRDHGAGPKGNDYGVAKPADEGDTASSDSESDVRTGQPEDSQVTGGGNGVDEHRGDSDDDGLGVGERGRRFDPEYNGENARAQDAVKTPDLGGMAMRETPMRKTPQAARTTDGY